MWQRMLLMMNEKVVCGGVNMLTSSLLAIIVFVLLVSYLFRSRRKQKLPPGPFGVPIFGYYPFLGKEPQKTLSEVGKKYGNVFGLYLGPQYVVVLNDWKSVIDAFGQNSTIHRPPSLFETVPYNFGFVGANGTEWVETRRMSTRAMKDIGLHSERWEDLIQEEVSDVVKMISDHGEGPLEIRRFLCDSFASSIVTLVLGKRLKHGHPIIKGVSDSVDAILEYSPTLSLGNFSPTLSKILQILGFERKNRLQEKTQEFAEFISKTTEDKIKEPDFIGEDSALARYYNAVEDARKKKVESYITEGTLKGDLIALLTGGSETGRTTIVWTLIAMADNPDMQEKVHEELDRVIGRDGPIRFADRNKIPYTYATLLESMRWATIVPMSTLRVASEDMQVQGIFIPKGTFLTGNFWSVHNDRRYWDKPEEFNPGRFLLDGGKKVKTSPESFIPFSSGKRNCPGKLIAHMEILQYFAILMQNFRVMPKEEGKVKYDTHLGLTYQALNVELCFIRR